MSENVIVRNFSRGIFSFFISKKCELRNLVEWIDEITGVPLGIKSKIEKCELQIKAADDIIEDGNHNLEAALDNANKKVDRNAVQTAHSKIGIGLERKRELEADLKDLNKKKMKLSKSWSTRDMEWPLQN